MLRKMSVIILLILTALWVTNSDSIRPAREFIQNNIYVWSETQEEKLPIYCVDTDKKQIALTFDTAWGKQLFSSVETGSANIQRISKQSTMEGMISQVMEIIINI